MKTSKSLKRIVLVTVISLAGFFLLAPFLFFGIMHYWVLTPERLTPLLTKEINERTNIRFSCKRVSLTYLDTWPKTGITIEEGRMETCSPDSTDSNLEPGISLSFQKLTTTFHPLEYFYHKSLVFTDAFLKNPRLTFNTNSKYKTLIEKTDLPMAEDVDLKLAWKRVVFSEGELLVNNKRADSRIIARQLSATLNGSVLEASSELSLSLTCDSLFYDSPQFKFEHDMQLKAQAECAIDSAYNHLSFGQSLVTLNQFPIRVTGDLKNLQKGDIPEIDLSFHLLAAELEELLNIVPSHYFPTRAQYYATGRTQVEGTLKGLICDSIHPDLHLLCKIEHGSLLKKNIKQGIDSLNIVARLHHLSNYPDSTTLQVEQLDVKGLNSYFKLRGRVSNLLHDPFIESEMKGYIDFNRIGTEFLNPDTIQSKGIIHADLVCAFRLQDVLTGRYDKVLADGLLDADHVELTSKVYKLDALISGAHIQTGYQKNKSHFIDRQEVVGMNMDVDSLRLIYQNNIRVGLGSFNLRMNTTLMQDGGGITPVTAHLNCKTLDVRINREAWVAAVGAEIHAGIKPSPGNPKEPVYACFAKAQAFTCYNNLTQDFASLKGGQFMAEVVPKASDGSNAPKTFAGRNDIKGLLTFDSSRLYHHQFPTPLSTGQVKLSVKNNQVVFSRSLLQAGNSDLIISGTLESTDKNGAPYLSGSLSVLSENIDYDEIREILLQGSMAAAIPATEAANEESALLNTLELGQKIEAIQKERAAAIDDQRLMIPSNVDLAIRLDANRASYHGVVLQRVTGDILLKDKRAELQINTQSNLGGADLHMMYSTPAVKKVHTTFDLKLQNALVGKIRQLVPSLNTLVPSLQSLDGVVDCHLTATCPLDKEMMPQLPEMKAACSLQGSNLVLFDSQTFKELAQKFHFKDKEKNELEHLTVSLLLKDGVIEVLPSLVEWDRYVVAVGGRHKLDMTFDYHLSMLKSPIPVNFGVNLTGKVDKFNYKITTKSRYADLFKEKNQAQYQAGIDKQISEIRQGILNSSGQ